MKGLEHKWHILAMEFVYSNKEFIMNKGWVGIYNYWAHGIGLLKAITYTNQFGKNPQGGRDRQMQDYRCKWLVFWMDKKPMLFLPTHQHPLLKEIQAIIMSRSGGPQQNIHTILVHLQYTIFVWGVNLAYQLRGYMLLLHVRSHKWWRRVFYFVLDISICVWSTLWKNEGHLFSPPNPKWDSKGIDKHMWGLNIEFQT